MAVSYIANLVLFPKNVLILSDSLSSLKALAKGGTNIHLELQQKILKYAHVILVKGIDLTFMWLPSHVGIVGNDFVDQAAKVATVSGIPVDLGFSVSEIKSKLRKISISNRLKKLKIRCSDHGWIYNGSLKVDFPRLPRKCLKTLFRIRTLSCNFLIIESRCACGTAISFPHIVSGCDHIPEMKHVFDLRKAFNLQPCDFLKSHPKLGDKPMRELLDAINNSLLRRLF